MKTTLLALGSVLFTALGCQAAPEAGEKIDWSVQGQPSVVTVQEEEGVFTLLRNGEPYFVRGVGGTSRLETLVEFGGNTVRTWDAEGIDDLMNEAHRLGLAVQVGIWLDHERHGHDYDDPEVKERQLAKVRRLVSRYKDHPALLTWGIGNEVELGGDLGKALRSIEDAAKLAKEIDPNHPMVAIIAEIGEDKAKRIAAECPSIDLLGVNAYGGMGSVPKRLLEQGYTGAYMVTEFGPLGHWEGPHAAWGAPIEQPSSQKAAFYANNYKTGVAAEAPGRCLGSFAFLWGHKQETTATWFGLILPTGETTEAVDKLSEFWTGEKLERHAPRVHGIDTPETDLGKLRAGQAFAAAVRAEDPDGDTLAIEWVVIAESTDRKSGGDAEAAPPAVEGCVAGSVGLEAAIVAPKEPGAYRLFVFVRDGTGRAGTANVPFQVVGD